MALKPLLLLLLVGLSLISAAEVPVKTEPEVVTFVPTEEAEAPAKKTEVAAPEEETEVAAPEEKTEVEEQPLEDTCVYTHETKGDITIKYELLEEGDRVKEIQPEDAADPEELLKECLLLNSVESRARNPNRKIIVDNKRKAYKNQAAKKPKPGAAAVASATAAATVKNRRKFGPNRANNNNNNKRVAPANRRRNNPPKNKRQQQQQKQQQQKQQQKKQKQQQQQLTNPQKVAKTEQIKRNKDQRLLNTIQKLIRDSRGTDIEKLNRAIELTERLLIRALRVY